MTASTHGLTQENQDSSVSRKFYEDKNIVKSNEEQQEKDKKQK